MQEVILGLIVLTALITPLYKLIKRRRKLKQELLLEDIDTIHSVSYTHLTLPTNREV